MQEGLNIQLVDLDNKSRKGLYYYIKKDGYKGIYLKYNSEFKIDSYVEYYNDKVIEKKPEGSIRAYQKAYSL